MLLGGGLCGSCVYFPCGKGSFIRAGVLPGLFLYSWHPTPGLEQIRTSKYDWLPGHKIRTNKSGVRLSGPTQRRPAPARLVTSAAWSGCRSGRVLSAGDCPACAAPPSGSAPPPLQCAGWLASYFVRLEILLQTKNSEWAAGAKARLAGPPSDPNTGHGGEVWGFRRQSGFSVTWAEGAAPRGLISRLCVWGVSTGSWVVFSQFGTGALVHCKSPEKGKGYSNHLFLNITAASKILIPAPSRERHFFCCSGMHPERPEQCTVGAERTPAHVHGRILHCWTGCQDSPPLQGGCSPFREATASPTWRSRKAPSSTSFRVTRRLAEVESFFRSSTKSSRSLGGKSTTGGVSAGAFPTDSGEQRNPGLSGWPPPSTKGPSMPTEVGAAAGEE